MSTKIEKIESNVVKLEIRVEADKFNEKGLMVKANDKTYYLKSDGSFTE